MCSFTCDMTLRTTFSEKGTASNTHKRAHAILMCSMGPFKRSCEFETTRPHQPELCALGSAAGQVRELLWQD
jgi:hypothetical protein